LLQHVSNAMLGLLWVACFGVAASHVSLEWWVPYTYDVPEPEHVAGNS
jgi:hypothetical protein